MVSRFSYILSWMIFGMCAGILIAEIVDGSFNSFTLVATCGWLNVIIYERRLGVK
jgi:hypothetical protein